VLTTGQYKRKLGGREGDAQSSPRDMSYLRKLFLDVRKSVLAEVSLPIRLHAVLPRFQVKYSSALHVRRHFISSLKAWERGKTACGRLGRQISARTKTSARLKITFVDMTYSGQRPEPPTLSTRFLLANSISMSHEHRNRWKQGKTNLLFWRALENGCYLWLTRSKDEYNSLPGCILTLFAEIYFRDL